MKHCLYCGAILEDEHESNICECCLDDRLEMIKNEPKYVEGTEEEYRYYKVITND